MPAALLRLPEHPEKAESNGRETHRREPANRRLAKARRLMVDADIHHLEDKMAGRIERNQE